MQQSAHRIETSKTSMVLRNRYLKVGWQRNRVPSFGDDPVHTQCGTRLRTLKSISIDAVKKRYTLTPSALQGCFVVAKADRRTLGGVTTSCCFILAWSAVRLRNDKCTMLDSPEKENRSECHRKRILLRWSKKKLILSWSGRPNACLSWLSSFPELGEINLWHKQTHYHYSRNIACNCRTHFCHVQSGFVLEGELLHHVFIHNAYNL